MWDPDPFSVARPSVQRPIVPPAAGPCDPPLVCVQFNADYAPFIAGALAQFTQPTALKTATSDDLKLALANFTWLVEIFGTAVQCNQPPMIPGQPTDDRACSIAGYLANYIIRESVSQGINAVTNSIGVLTAVWGIIRFVPGFAEALPVTWLAMNALLAGITAIGTGPFQTAIDDPSLFPAITCAIFTAIRTDGQVTTANFPFIVANINALTFADSGVKSTILDFVNNLGAGGLQAVQTGGPLAVYDCTGCGSGASLGPIGPSPWRLSGSQLLQIAIGAFEGVVPILFPAPFDTPPLLTMSCDNQDVIGSFDNVSITGCDLRITSAIPAGATMMANLDWTASLPGVD